MATSGGDLPARAVATALPGLTAALLAATVAGWLGGSGHRGAAAGLPPFSLVTAVVFTVLGLLVVPRRPRNAVGWLFLLIGSASARAAAASSWSHLPEAAWLAQWTPWLAYGLLPLPLLLFPDGHLPGRRWRWVLVTAVAGVLVTSAALAVGALDAPTTLLTEVDTPLTPRARGALVVAAAGVACSSVGATAAVTALWSRWRCATGEDRQQLKWLGVGAAVSVAALVLDMAGVPGAWSVAALAVPVAAAVAILAHRLYDVDLFLRRSVVYAVLTVFVVVSYSLFVNLLDAVLGDWQGRDRSIIATAAVAAAFHPVQVRVQRQVDRLLFGDRSDPYAAVSRMSRSLEQPASTPTDDPADLLRGIARAVADALHLPYVALTVGQQGGQHAVAEFGRRTGEVVVTTMTHHGRAVGLLTVTPRSRREGLTVAERRLLHDLARQAALAAHAVVVTSEVQRARERLVRAREEERRRLRRDLHDGLGAALAGLRMQVSTAPYLLDAGDTDAVRQLLRRLDEELGRYTAEVRRLIEGLTPAALEQLGLPGAVRRAALAFERGEHPLAVDVVAAGVPERPGQLAAAVEIAGYHISVEAIANAARHAGATSCQVRLTMSDVEMVVEVLDDGRGLPRPGSTGQPGGPAARRSGVGFESMRERASELGGTFVVASVPRSGGRVLARLPLAPS